MQHDILKSSNESGHGLIAVIIGIDGYVDLEPLSCAVNDAVAITDTLKKIWSGRNVSIKTLIWPHNSNTGEQHVYGVDIPDDPHHVTKDYILETIREITENCHGTETFIFFFAGHGKLIDGRPSLITIKDPEASSGVEFLGIEEIKKSASSQLKNKVIVLDCCQDTEEEAREFLYTLNENLQGWSIFLSCSPGEESREDNADEKGDGDYLQQGLFTASLVEGLRGEAAKTEEENINLFELALFVCSRVQNESQVRREEDYLQIQHPILITDKLALGGPYEIILAPKYVPPPHKMPRNRPSRNFITYFLSYLWGNYPLKLLYPKLIREGNAVCYSIVISATIFGWLLEAQRITRLQDITGAIFLVSGIFAITSFILWWLIIPFIMAANEDRWFFGGYITILVTILWHIFVFLLLFFFIKQYSPYHSLYVTLLGGELFLIMGAFLVYGCNSLQAMIALAEPLRKDGRGEIRHAIRIFQQFKKKQFNVDVSNFIPQISAKPIMYFWVYLFCFSILSIHTTYFIFLLIFYDYSPLRGSATLIRNCFLFLFITIQLLWYNSMFHRLQRELYSI